MTSTQGALWHKTFGDARSLLTVLSVLLLLFAWLFVWLSGFFQPGPLLQFWTSLPSAVAKLSPIPLDVAVTRMGMISMLYVHPLTMLVTFTWTIARGSAAVSGEIDGGTMELVLAQPVRRSTLLWIQAAVTILGSAALATALWLGIWLGVTVLSVEIDPLAYLPGSVMFFALHVCFAGLATFCSSWDRYRWRTIGIMGGFVATQIVLELLRMLWPAGWWCGALTVLAAYDPQAFIIGPIDWSAFLFYNGTLLGVGLAAYVAATLVFCRRDLPAPL